MYTHEVVLQIQGFAKASICAMCILSKDLFINTNFSQDRNNYVSRGAAARGAGSKGHEQFYLMIQWVFNVKQMIPIKKKKKFLDKQK